MSEWLETDIGKVPASWEIGTLGEISQLLTDGAHSSPKPIASKYRMASVKDMRYNHFELSGCKTISQSDFDKLVDGNCSPQIGDILLSKDGANCLDLIFVYKQKEKIVLLSSIAIARLKDGYAPDFYRYFLLSPNTQDLMRNNYVSGSAIPRVILKDFKNVPVPLVSFPEQKAIAEVLSSLDDKIDLLHRQNKTLEQMAETLFRQWFVEEAGEDWEEVTVSQFVNLNSRSITKEYLLENIEYLDTGSLTEGNFGEYQSYRLVDSPSRAKRLVQHNDILVSTVRPNQKHYGIVKQPLENLVVSTGFCVITCHDIDPHFIYLLLTNDEMTEYLHSIAEGSTSTYPSLKPADIGAIEFKLPPEHLLTQFSKIANENWEKIQRNYDKVKTLKSLRDTLLPKLMSGEIRVEI